MGGALTAPVAVPAAKQPRGPKRGKYWAYVEAFAIDNPAALQRETAKRFGISQGGYPLHSPNPNRLWLRFLG
jgi:hypothetical protein